MIILMKMKQLDFKINQRLKKKRNGEINFCKTCYSNFNDNSKYKT